MLKIGITGGIGSGKTTVCKIFEILDIPIFYADAVARTITDTDPALVKRIIKTFGNESYHPDGLLNRPYIAGLVFNDLQQLKKLNELVHPAVFRAFDDWLPGMQNNPYVLKEAALLFESGSYRMCNYSILVKSPEELKIQRVMQRDNLTADAVKARIDKQWTDAEKEQLTDFVIMNDEKQLLIPQVLRLHRQFISMLTVAE